LRRASRRLAVGELLPVSRTPSEGGQAFELARYLGHENLRFPETDGDNPTITVEIEGLAAHGSAPDPIGQRKACLLSASPSFVGPSCAQLAASGVNRRSKG
jgi:hypothetical protein